MKADALIMAAGLGKRMLPLTRSFPKPLVPLCGTTMIETVIKALNRYGVRKIFVVTGYLGRQFEFLKEKYGNVSLIPNKEFATKNNISSVFAAADYLGGGDCFICEGDLFISDANIFLGITDSCYFGKFVKGYSEDWVFETKDNRITEIKKGGTDLYNMTGVSFFRQNDLKILLDAIKDAYKRSGHENLFWDEVAGANLDKLNLTLKPVTQDQIIEIDTLAELEKFIEERY